MTLARLRERTAAPYLIAEAGVNHGGDMGVAVELVRRAASMGVDGVKFQTYRADRLAVKDSPAYWDTTQEPTQTQHDLFSRYDGFEQGDYRRLAEECASLGLDFLSTPFDVDVVDWLDELVPMWKVASGDITNLPLLRRIAATAKPVLLSTGAASIDEVAQAVAWLREGGVEELSLLHCTLAYPTATTDANLGAIRHLAASFPEAVPGYSDHTTPPVSFAAIACAYTLGARVIEKHYTIDKSLPGNDHYHAFDPNDFTALHAQLAELRQLLGTGEKVVLPAEQPARTGARRSLVARVPIHAGMPLTGDLFDVKRPATGVPPAFLAELDGWVAACEIEEDTIVDWAMLRRA